MINSDERSKLVNIASPPCPIHMYPSRFYFRSLNASRMKVMWRNLKIALLLSGAISTSTELRATNGINYDVYLKEESPAVLHVRDDHTLWDNAPACHAERGNEIWFDVANLPRWLYDNGETNALTLDDKSQKYSINYNVMLELAHKLIPYADGHALKGMVPDAVVFWEPSVEVTEKDGTKDWINRPIYFLRYRLSPIKDNKENMAAWHSLWLHPSGFERQMEMTLGLEKGATMPTAAKSDSKVPSQQFYLVLFSKNMLIASSIVIAIALIIFVILAICSDLLRDPFAAIRPDGRLPYSLASTQMAFWLFIVTVTYLFLWVLTGASDSLNTTALTLIGISSLTGLGAKLIRSDSNNKYAPKHDYPRVDITQKKEQVIQDLENLIATEKINLKALLAERGTIDATAQPALEANAAKVQGATDKIFALEHQLSVVKHPIVKGFFLDLLAEDKTISFHRFQIIVWTMILGIIFVANVYTDLAMPDFSVTTLGLLGISAGTYLGFKFPDDKR